MEKIKQLYKKVKPFINKYTIAGAIFVAVMLFGKYSYVDYIRLNNKVHSLQKEKERYEKEIGETKVRLNQLKNNSGDLERFAREQYLMKKENEEIFIVPEK